MEAPHSRAAASLPLRCRFAAAARRRRLRPSHTDLAWTNRRRSLRSLWRLFHVRRNADKADDRWRIGAWAEARCAAARGWHRDHGGAVDGLCGRGPRGLLFARGDRSRPPRRDRVLRPGLFKRGSGGAVRPGRRRGALPFDRRLRDAGALEIGLGRVATRALRFEVLAGYRPRLEFRGRANFLEPMREQAVEAKVSSLAALLAVHVDLPAVGVPKVGPLGPFVGVGAGVVRARVTETTLTFSRTTTIVPGADRTEFAWMVTARRRGGVECARDAGARLALQ